jgi:hypothetical protein
MAAASAGTGVPPGRRLPDRSQCDTDPVLVERFARDGEAVDLRDANYLCEVV